MCLICIGLTEVNIVIVPTGIFHTVIFSYLSDRQKPNEITLDMLDIFFDFQNCFISKPCKTKLEQLYLLMKSIEPLRHTDSMLPNKNDAYILSKII